MPDKKPDDFIEGDVLARDITNSQGVVLARAGTELKDAHRRLFRMWGVKTIAVAGPDDPEAGNAVTVTEEHLNQAEETLKNCFGDSLDNEVTAEIFRVGVEIRAGKLAAGEIHDSD